MKIFYGLIGLMICTSLFGTVDHSSPFTHGSGVKIKRFALIGQRCSGTNFVEHLMKKNFPNCRFYVTDNVKDTPHKHHWPKIDGTTDFPFLHFDSCLFVLVVRNPYDWLSSLFIHSELMFAMRRKNFSTFLRCQARHVFEDRRFDTHFGTNNPPFSNILAMRNYEIANFLEAGKRVKNFAVVSYDTVNSDPEGFIEYLANYFQLKRSRRFVSVNTYKGCKNRAYKPRNYAPITPENLDFIFENLNWDIENQLGFFPR